jgi:hypothetical protein
MIGCADDGAMLTREQQGIVCDRARLAIPAGLRPSAQRDGQNCTPSGQLCAALDVPADGDAVGTSAPEECGATGRTLAAARSFQGSSCADGQLRDGQPTVSRATEKGR